MTCPSDPVNLYDDDVIRNPWPHYARLRDKGPVIWMEALGNYAFTHYDVVRRGLRDHDMFISGLGTAADDFGCQHQRGNTVASGPEGHTVLRQAILPPLKSDNVAKIKPRIQEGANKLWMRVLSGKDNMLKWASAAFDMQGIQNERGQAACGVIAEMRGFIAQNPTADTLKPESWTHRICEMAKQGALDAELALFANRDFTKASLDTTISAIGQPRAR